VPTAAHTSGAIQVHGLRHQIATSTADAHTAGTSRLIATTMHARTNPTPTLATHDIENLFLVTVGDFHSAPSTPRNRPDPR
jgi:hypothetical protein